MQATMSRANVRQLDLVHDNGERQIDVRSYAEARSALLALLRWADQEAADRPFNTEAVHEAAITLFTWLQPGAPVEKTLKCATRSLSRLAATYCDYDWLFDDEGELRIPAVSSDLFDLLVEARIVADRINRAVADELRPRSG